MAHRVGFGVFSAFFGNVRHALADFDFPSREQVTVYLSCAPGKGEVVSEHAVKLVSSREVTCPACQRSNLTPASVLANRK